MYGCIKDIHINSDAQMSTFQSLYTIKVTILSVEHVGKNISPDLL